MYQLFNVSREITLNSKGKLYDAWYVHDQEICTARWLQYTGELEGMVVYTDSVGSNRLVSGAGILQCDSRALFEPDKKIRGYIYLRYYNVTKGKLRAIGGRIYNMKKFEDKFIGKGKIYSNGGSQVWK